MGQIYPTKTYFEGGFFVVVEAAVVEQGREGRNLAFELACLGRLAGEDQDAGLLWHHIVALKRSLPFLLLLLLQSGVYKHPFDSGNY